MLLAITGLSHLYFGFALLVEAAMNGSLVGHCSEFFERAAARSRA